SGGSCPSASRISAAPRSTWSSPAVSASSLPKLRERRSNAIRRSPAASACSTDQVASVLPSSTYTTRQSSPCVAATSSSTAARRGCSTGRLSASLKAATTTVRRSSVAWASALIGRMLARDPCVVGHRRALQVPLLQPVEITRAADLAHLALDRPRAALHVRAGARRAVAFRTGQHRRQPGRLGRPKLGRILPEVGAGGGLGPVDAIAELGDVDVHLEDPRLRPKGFNQHRVPGF